MRFLENLTNTYRRYRGLLAAPVKLNNHLGESIRVYIVWALTTITWLTANFVDGYSTKQGFVEILQNAHLGNLYTALICIMIVLPPLCINYISSSATPRHLYHAILALALVAHLLSGTASARFFMDLVGDGLDYEERHNLVLIAEQVNRDIAHINEELHGIVRRNKALSKMMDKELVSGAFSGKGGGQGAKYRELQREYERTAAESLIAQDILTEAEPTILSLATFDPMDKETPIATFYALCRKLPSYYRQRLASFELISAPNSMLGSLRAMLPWAHDGQRAVLAWAGWVLSLLLEAFVFTLGALLAPVTKAACASMKQRNFDRIAKAAWGTAKCAIASHMTVLYSPDSNEGFASKLTTSIIYESLKNIDPFRKNANGYALLGFNEEELNQPSICAEQGYCTLDDSLRCFWRKAIPIMEDMGIADIEEGHVFINVELYESWALHVNEKRPRLGRVDLKNLFALHLLNTFEPNEIGNKYTLVEDFDLDTPKRHTLPIKPAQSNQRPQ